MIGIDPFTMEVIRNAILTIAEEMRVIMMRSARSALLKEAGDMSCALFDARGRLIAQGRDQPIHLGVMAITVKEFLKRFPPETLRNGDMYFTNAMDVGGNHLPDVKAIKPIFLDDRLVAFAVNLAHWSDIGGALPGSYVPTATELVQEGLYIPSVRLFTADGVDKQLLDFILYNIRTPEEREGDIYAQYACNEVAAGRLLEVFGHHGVDTVIACMERMLEESETWMRTSIREVTDGTYSGEDYLDNDGFSEQPVKIKVQVTIHDDSLTFDFTSSAPEVAGPLNCTYGVTVAGVYYMAKTLFGPDIPTNDGCYCPIKIIAPAGTIVNAGLTAPRIAGNHETVQRIIDAILLALAPALPDRIVAGGEGTACVLIIAGKHDDTGKHFIMMEVHGGGSGAQATQGGDNGIRVHVANTMNTPIEALEEEYPVLVTEYGLRTGSGGQGRHRGGLGIRRAYKLIASEARVTTLADRYDIPPWGVFGGGPSLPLRFTLNPGTPQEVKIPGKGSFTMRRGDTLLVETPGGGGYGPFEERSPKSVENDHLLGYV